MKKKPSIVCLGVRDNEADMGRIVTKGRRQKEMLRNKEASCPPSLFLVFSLSLHLSLFSSVDIPQRQASKPSAFPSLYLLFSSVRDIDCFRPTHTRIFFPSKQLPSLSKLVFALRVSSIRLATRESFDKKRKKKTILSHGARKCLQETRSSSRWPNPQGLADSTPLRTAQVCMVANQRARDHRAAVLAERDAAVLAARSRVLPLPVPRGEVRGTFVSGPKADGRSLRVLRSERAALHYWTSTSTSFRVKKLRAFQTAMQLHPARNPGDVQGLSTRFWTRPGCTTPMSSSLV